MRYIGLWLVILFFSFDVAALDTGLENLISSESSDYEKARVLLLSRVDRFNFLEGQLLKLNPDLPSDAFKVQVANLVLPSAHRDQLIAAYTTGDRRVLVTALRDAMVAAYTSLKISREEWESNFRIKWTQAQFEDLKKSHLEIINIQRNFARSRSDQLKIRFDDFREDYARVKLFCRNFPKGGMLHVHPYGTMNRATVEKVLALFDPTINEALFSDYLKEGAVEKIHPRELSFFKDRAAYYAVDRKYSEMLADYPEDAKKIQNLFFMPLDVSLYNQRFTPFERFLGAFAAPLKLLGILNGNIDNQLALEKILYDDFFLRSLQNKIWYAEFTRNLPVLKDSREVAERYRALTDWATNIETTPRELGPFYPRTLLSFNRTTMDSDRARVQQVQLIGQILSLPLSPKVVGINLMGNEENRSALDSAQFIYGKLLLDQPATPVRGDAHRFLRGSIHAGEAGDVRNLRDALIFGVQRIGHGVKFMQNPVYLEIARRRGVAIETSLSSNDILHVSTIGTNPFLYFHRLGLKVSLSTDDEGMFETDSNLECEKAISRTDIQYTELRDMMINSIATSFAEDSLKPSLLRQLQVRLVDFENRWLKKRF